MMAYPSQAYQGRLGFDKTPVGFSRAQGYLRRESLGDFMRQLNLAEEERFKRMRRGYGEQLAGMKRGIGGQIFGLGMQQWADRFAQPREPVMGRYDAMKWPLERKTAPPLQTYGPPPPPGLMLTRRPWSRQRKQPNLTGYRPPLRQYP